MPPVQRTVDNVHHKRALEDAKNVLRGLRYSAFSGGL